MGVVYILPNGELTPVFNIRGCSNVSEYNKKNKDILYSNIDIYNKEGERNYIQYNESTYLINPDKDSTSAA